MVAVVVGYRQKGSERLVGKRLVGKRLVRLAPTLLGTHPHRVRPEHKLEKPVSGDSAITLVELLVEESFSGVVAFERETETREQPQKVLPTYAPLARREPRAHNRVNACCIQHERCQHHLRRKVGGLTPFDEGSGERISVQHQGWEVELCQTLRRSLASVRRGMMRRRGPRRHRVQRDRHRKAETNRDNLKLLSLCINFTQYGYVFFLYIR